MTVAATQRAAGPYIGNGSATAFAFAFKVFAHSDVQLAVYMADGTAVLPVLDVDYSVAMNADQVNDPGGTVTYPISGDPLEIDGTLAIVGDLPYDQTLSLPQGGNFSPIALGNALDRLAIQIQQIREITGRSFVFPVGDPPPPTFPPRAGRAGKLLGFDGDGDFIGVLPGPGDASELALDLLNSSNPAKGDALVGVKRTEANAVGRTLNFYVQHSKLLVANYCDPTADTAAQVTTALANAIADAKAGGKVLEFDPGATYTTTAAVAFLGTSGLKGLRFWGNGATLYRSSGAGPVALLDSGSNTLSNYDIEFADFRLRGNASSTYGLYTRALQGSRVDKVRVVDVATAAFKVDWSVCSKFKDLSMSTNQDTFAVNAAKGLIVDQSSAGNYTAACLFENTRFEGSCITDVGIELVYADLNNKFRGGTCEAVPRGFRALSTSNRNVISEMDFEQNSDYDISIAGNGLTLQDVNASSPGTTGTTIVAATAQNTTFRGGFHSWVAHHASSRATRHFGTKVSDSASVGITGATSGSAPAAGILQTYGVVKVDGNLVPTGLYPDTCEPTAAYSPALNQGTGVAATASLANARVANRIAHLRGKLVATAAGTAGQGIAISGFPAAATSEVGLPCGRFVYSRAATPIYEGTLQFVSATSVTLQASGQTNLLGIAPSFAVAADDVLTWSADYELA